MMCTRLPHPPHTSSMEKELKSHYSKIFAEPNNQNEAILEELGSEGGVYGSSHLST